MTTPQLKILLVVALGGALLCPAASHAVSGNLPLDSGAYEILDHLNAQGCLRTYLSGTKPITYGEAYRLLNEARGMCEVEKPPADPADAWLSGAPMLPADQNQPSPGKKVVGRKTGWALGRLEYILINSLKQGVGISPIRDPEFELVYLDGDPSSIPGINASQNALIYNNEGIEPDEWVTGYMTFQSELFLGAVNAQVFPLLSTADHQKPPLVHRAYVKAGTIDFEVGAGKESLWWGQGRHGSLYLTNNAQPMPMVRYTNQHPLYLPWIFQYLGPFRLDIFMSRLEEDRAVPEPYLGGIRFNFRPSTVLELGTTVLFMTGGEGRPDVNLSDLFEILFGENEHGGEDRSNKIAGFDFRLTLPGWQVYGEFGGEDEANGLPSKMAGLVGLYIPRVSESVDLTFEYVDLAYTREIAAAWYRHGIYTDGYTYKGRILGHHVGGDSRDFYSEVAFDLGQWAKGKVAVDIQRRGLHLQPVPEDHHQLLVSYEQIFGREENNWKGKLTAAVDKVRNVDYVDGDEDNMYYFSIAVSLPL